MQSPSRLAVVHGVLIALAATLLAKAGREQLLLGDRWAATARRQHFAQSRTQAPRGEIADASGGTLVESREVTRVSVAPRELRDTARLRAALRSLGMDARWVATATDQSRRWVELPGRYLPADVASLAGMTGVYSTPVMERVYADASGIRRIVGRVDPNSGQPLDGIELALSDVLQGDTGRASFARDRAGRALGLATDAGAAATPGRSVVLTINRGLQDISERALAKAVDSLGATGGDIVVMNPNTGDILAMASNRADPRAVANTAITEPYEPGSTVKPFVAAALLARKLARPGELIDTYGGQISVDGRLITDAEEHERMMSLSDVIRRSSNVGIVRFALRLSPDQKYQLLRDMGFGTPTLVPLPAESPGTLREPARWSRQSAASVMMGYELTVTPLQLVTAYSAIANGGELLQPQLVREVRSASGEVEYRASRRVVRRVMPPEVATQIRQMLLGVVQSGTSTNAELATFDVAGKSGTARRTSNGVYTAGAYTSSFVGVFPADRPQYVVLVKLDNPRNGYYGGVVAGAVTNVVLRAALAARDAALDRSQLALAERPEKPDTSARARFVADSTRRARARVEAATPPVVVATAAPPDTGRVAIGSYLVRLPPTGGEPRKAAGVRPVPSVAGLPLRSAVRTLHAAGFRVELVAAGGTPFLTYPSAGTALAGGRVVKLAGVQ